MGYLQRWGWDLAAFRMADTDWNLWIWTGGHHAEWVIWKPPNSLRTRGATWFFQGPHKWQTLYTRINLQSSWSTRRGNHGWQSLRYSLQPLFCLESTERYFQCQIYAWIPRLKGGDGHYLERGCSLLEGDTFVSDCRPHWRLYRQKKYWTSEIPKNSRPALLPWITGPFPWSCFGLCANILLRSLYGHNYSML